MINTKLSDGKGTNKSVHLHQKNGDIGIVAYTQPIKEYDAIAAPFFNPTYGVEMAINAGFGGTPEVVHVGISDGVYWTGSQITPGGEINFNSGAQAHSGSVSVYMNRPDQDETWQFAKGSDMTMANYTAITMYIYVDNNWAAGDSTEFYGWDTDLGVQVGVAVALEDYFTFDDFDTWHKVTIPLTDMEIEAATTLDAFRMEAVSIQGQRPRWYIDDFQIEETGTPAEFTVSAANGTLFLLDELRFNIIDAYDPALADSNMPNLSYNKLLGEASLPNGLVLKRTSDGEVDFAITLNKLQDFINIGTTISDLFSDGTNTSLTLSFIYREPLVLDSRSNDTAIFTISDDLTGLISMRALLIGREEKI